MITENGKYKIGSLDICLFVNFALQKIFNFGSSDMFFESFTAEVKKFNEKIKDLSEEEQIRLTSEPGTS